MKLTRIETEHPKAPLAPESGLPDAAALPRARDAVPARAKSRGEVANDEPAGEEGEDAEWAVTEPTDKDMGLVRLTLDKGVKTTVIGQLYGLDFEIEGDGFSVRVFFDNYNRRLKVVDYSATDYAALCDRLIWLAGANNYDKIFIKARRDDWQEFLCLGFILEGILKYYYAGNDAYVLSRFSSLERALSNRLISETTLIEKLMRTPVENSPNPLGDDLSVIACQEEHIPSLVSLYRSVFKTYPSPLTHPDYIQQTMRRNIIYRAVVDSTGKIISAASAEVDSKHSNAEVTDCATVPEHRGGGLMHHLIRALEDDLRTMGIKTAYSLARAQSQGMNRVFRRLGYEYSGRLVNNCDIYGQFEDMNIWAKLLDSKAV